MNFMFLSKNQQILQLYSKIAIIYDMKIIQGAHASGRRDPEATRINEASQGRASEKPELLYPTRRTSDLNMQKGGLSPASLLPYLGPLLFLLTNTFESSPSRSGQPSPYQHAKP